MTQTTLERESELYGHLWDGNDKEVMEICKKTPDGPFQKCTIYGATVLHSALYMGRYELAEKLLDHHLPDDDSVSRLLYDTIDGWGDTLLHNAAHSDNMLEITKKLLQKDGKHYLVQVKNKWGETPLFQATRYGQLKQFKLLAKEVHRKSKQGGGGGGDDDFLQYFVRKDGITILHMAILTRNFGMAVWIAKNYPELHTLRSNIKSKIQMTPLQMLACSPDAFKSGAELGSFKKHIYDSINDVDLEIDDIDTDLEIKDEDEPKGGVLQKVVSKLLKMSWKPRCILPMLDAVKEEKKAHKRAELLAQILVKSDNTWLEGYKLEYSGHTPQIIGGDDNDKAKDGDIEAGISYKRTNSGNTSDADEIPLILAAKYGCVEIIEAILGRSPQANEYFNGEHQTYLHVAIKHRNMEVFKLKDPENSPVKSQLWSIDIHGNSILHMVALSPTKTPQDSNMKSPVLQLSADLQRLEDLKKMCPLCLINHHNFDLLTADQLFAKTNEKQLDDAKEWLKRTAEHCTVVIVLIATVAFASAYTVPGGPNSQTGYPILLSKPLFLVFTVADVLSLGFALTAVVIFLAILTSSFQMKEFRKSLPEKLLLGFTLLFLSVSMMMVAFAATIILMINNKERWTKIGVYVVAFFPVCIFMLSYIPLYVKLADSLWYWASKISKYLPRITCSNQSSSGRSSSAQQQQQQRLISSYLPQDRV